MKTRQIEIDGKMYTLTVTRSLVMRMAKSAPELLKIARSQDAKKLSAEEQENFAIDFSISIYDNIDVLFYEMIKIAHKGMSKETSDKIFDKFCEEYEGVEDHLIEFFQQSFTDGIPNNNKKKIDW